MDTLDEFGLGFCSDAWSPDATNCATAASVPCPSLARATACVAKGSSSAITADSSGLLAPAPATEETDDGVVLDVHYALFHRDDPVVGDLDVLWAHFRAALGDVAVTKALGFLKGLLAVKVVVWVHIELGIPDEKTWPGKIRFVFLVVADHVAGVLAEPAFDALAELLGTFHVSLVHRERGHGLVARSA